MSVSETEPVAVPDEPEPDENEDELNEDEEEDEPAADEETEAESAGTVVLTDKEEKKQEKALEAEALRHAARISAILGEAATQLIQCEACPRNTPGFHYPAKAFPADSLEYTIYNMLAGGTDAVRKHPDYFKTCEECNGWGTVDTGAQPMLVTAAIMCPVCKNAGYIDTRTELPTPAPVITQANGSPSEPGGDLPNQPDWWGRPVGHKRHGKFPIFLTPAERAEDLAAGYTVNG